MEPLTQPQQYGDPSVNKCIWYLTEKLGGVAPDGKNNRRFCKLLLDALGRDYPQGDPVTMVIRLIDIAHGHPCRNRATSFSWLYYNRTMLIMLGKEQKERAGRSQKTADQQAGYKIIRKA